MCNICSIKYNVNILLNIKEGFMIYLFNILVYIKYDK